jgi:RNA polymerase sigma-B factor
MATIELARTDRGRHRTGQGQRGSNLRARWVGWRPDLSSKHRTYARCGDAELRQELIEAHIGLARRLAARFTGRGEELDDLIQVARLGLIKALDRYDPGRGTSFATFATPTIVGELKRHFRDRAWPMRVPRSLQERYLAARNAGEALRQDLGRSPTMDEVAASVGASPEEVVEALEAGHNYWTLSLDAPSRDDDHRPLSVGKHDDGMRRVEDRMQLERLVENLSTRDRRILRLRFMEELSQAEIAAREGLSQVAVSKILARTVHSLRSAAAA